MTRKAPGDELKIAADCLAYVQSQLEIEIREAHKQGLSLRKIAAAVGLNHETVRTIIRKGDEPNA